MQDSVLSIDDILNTLQPTITPINAQHALSDDYFNHTANDPSTNNDSSPHMEEFISVDVSETLTEETESQSADVEETVVEERPVLEDIEGVEEVHHNINFEATARFSGAEWFNEIQKRSIIIGGQGGISSWLTLLLARMHPEQIYTYDPDHVEILNLAGQLFSTKDAGMLKGNAIAKTVASFANYYKMMVIPELYTSDSLSGPIMFCGFDNMAARKVFFNQWRYYVSEMPADKRKEALFIDGRLNAETLQVLCIRGDSEWDKVTYVNEYLFNDSEAEHTICSFKQTAFMANMIASMMVNLYVNHCANLVGGCRTIPFYTSYEADQMYLVEEGGI